MLQKSLFILALIFTVSMVNAQSTGVVGNSEIVKEIPVLKALADKVNVAHAELSKSTTGTRTSNTTTQANYTSALNAYLTELEHQLSLGNTRNETALKSEISLVKELQTAPTKSTTK